MKYDIVLSRSGDYMGPLSVGSILCIYPLRGLRETMWIYVHLSQASLAVLISHELLRDYWKYYVGNCN